MVTLRKGEDITRHNYEVIISTLNEREKESQGVLKFQTVKSFFEEWFT